MDEALESEAGEGEDCGLEVQPIHWDDDTELGKGDRLVEVQPKLLPFAIECAYARPNTIVMEDGAAAHASQFQLESYEKAGMKKLDWPGNSPDLNMIEPAWFHLKRRTSRMCGGGPPKTKAEAKEVWEKAWKDLDQATIQLWIEGIPRHIRKVIALEGGNEYREGRSDRLGERDGEWEKKGDEQNRS